MVAGVRAIRGDSPSVENKAEVKHADAWATCVSLAIL